MYINKSTNQFPVSEAEIRLAFPNTSFPTPFQPPSEFAWVFVDPVPAYDTITQGIRLLSPQEVNDKWSQAWEVYALDPETVAQNQAAAQKRLTDEIVFNTQKRLDEFARTRNYDGILSACTYATSTVPKFQAEGQYCVNMRDATWATLYQYLADVQAGTKPIPTGYADVEPFLPDLIWPQ